MEFCNTELDWATPMVTRGLHGDEGEPVDLCGGPPLHTTGDSRMRDHRQLLKVASKVPRDLSTESRPEFNPSLAPSVPLNLVQLKFNTSSSMSETLQRVYLPNTLKVFDSCAGIKQECKRNLRTVSKCARYSETAIKWVSHIIQQRYQDPSRPTGERT